MSKLRLSDSLIIMHGAGNVLKNPVKTMNENNSEITEEPIVQPETQVDPNETIRELEEQLAKEQEEKENYKQGMLKYKEQVKEEEPEWDESSKKFQAQTLSKVETLAGEKATKTVESFNEKAGIAKFQEAHPDVDMKEVLANYNPKNGKFSADSVVRDLERALVLHQYDSGTLSSEVTVAEEKGRKRGVAETKVADLNTVSKTTSKTAPQGNTLTDSELYLAKQMKVDPEKLAAEDMTKPAEIEIN